jgi:hypothetical protein
MGVELVKYDAACRAIAEATSLDEVREIASRAEALKAYARQARNRELEIDARSIRLRAERRMGELIIEIRKEKTFKNGRLRLIEDIGLSGTESAAAQRLALMADKDFEHAVSEWREMARRTRTVQPPLQSVRQPSEYISKSRAAARGRPIEQADPLDQFRAMDGRAYADCLVGEIRRMAALTRRQLRALEQIAEKMPVANPDPLSPIGTTFGRIELLSLLRDIWESEATPIFPNVLADLPSARGGHRAGAGRKRHG